ncbi:hypothetical protein ACFPAF_04770 [Hymenobacter endophyticus]|uniref:DUF4468 domain-containing protein n=1 Tax=Hymenobacter endophyticus TaxID=3076335 RepID=A0ABU3TE93_9BACT|nr:hypothetical protein [Hymenobacter endophyticus]MDU0369697.1 hypothetical protein [Hymenobacter endophyticus]
MKTSVLALLMGLPAVGWAQSATSPAALAQRINQLMRDPEEPDTEVRVAFSDCHFTQTIRKYRPQPANSATTVQVSHRKNGGEWAVRSDEKVEFELKLGSDWQQITELTYAPAHREKTGGLYYQLKLKRERKEKGSSNTTNFELPLYTTNEATVQTLVRQLNQLRRNCGGQ